MKGTKKDTKYTKDTKDMLCMDMVYLYCYYVYNTTGFTYTMQYLTQHKRYESLSFRR